MTDEDDRSRGARLPPPPPLFSYTCDIIIDLLHLWLPHGRSRAAIRFPNATGAGTGIIPPRTDVRNTARFTPVNSPEPYARAWHYLTKIIYIIIIVEFFFFFRRNISVFIFFKFIFFIYRIFVYYLFFLLLSDILSLLLAVA